MGTSKSSTMKNENDKDQNIDRRNTKKTAFLTLIKKNVFLVIFCLAFFFLLIKTTQKVFKYKSFKPVRLELERNPNEFLLL